MEKHTKKVCIVTWFDSMNYGTCIQCYALTKYLSDQGYFVVVPESYRYYYGIQHPIETFSRLLNKINQRINPPNVIIDEKEIDNNIRKGYIVRRKKNTEFAYRYNNIYKITSKEDFLELIKTYDVFITGSDQIWNPGYVTPPYLLSFVKKQNIKIAYGSSIGVEHIPRRLRSTYRKYLLRFSKIGVRELTAKHELEDLLKREIKAVLDPSFLLKKLEWSEVAIKTANETANEPYIFCYFLGKNTEWIQKVKKFGEEQELKVYCALSESNIIPDYGTILPSMGVQEFIYYLLNSSYVVTDSFHATALSINFNNPFAVYKRFVDGASGSQNSRIIDLLNEFGLERCLVANDSNNLDFMLEDYNYTNVNNILEQKRKSSIKFLINAIEGI